MQALDRLGAGDRDGFRCRGEPPSPGRPAGPVVHTEPRHEAGAIGAAEALGSRASPTNFPTILRPARRAARSCIALGASPGICNGIGHGSQGLLPGIRMDGPRGARAFMVGGHPVPRLAPWVLDGRPLDGRGAWDGEPPSRRGESQFARCYGVSGPPSRRGE